MTTTASGRSATSAGNGVTTIFAVPFQFILSSDLLVYLLDGPDDENADGVLWTEGVDYTVTGDGAAGGASVVAAIAPANGTYLRRWRETSRDQADSYTPNDGFPAKEHERGLDRLSLVTEELSDDTSRIDARAVKVIAGEDALTVPAIADRPGKALGFNGDGSAMVPITIGDGNDPGLRDDLADDGLGGELVAFKMPVSDAAARTLSAKVGESWITISDMDHATEEGRAALAMSKLGGGVHLRLEETVSITSELVIDGKSDFEIRGRGALRVANGTACAANKGTILIRNCARFLVEGLTLDGNRANRSFSGETDTALLKVYSCQDGTIRRITCRNSPLDGILNSATAGTGTGGGPSATEMPARMVYEDCDCDGNWRNGLAIVDGWGVTVRGGTYRNTSGSRDGGGAGPSAGIDIESDHQAGWTQGRLRKILIDGVTFDGNQGPGLQVSNVDGPTNIVARDCEWRNSRQAAIILEAPGTRIIRGMFDGWTDDVYATGSPPARRGLIDVTADAGANILIQRPVFRNIAATGVPHSETLQLIYAHFDSDGKLIIEDPDVDASAIQFCQLWPVKCEVIGGNVDGVTKASAIEMNGVDAVVSGVALSGCGLIAITANAARAHIHNNLVEEPSANNSGGCIFVTGADSDVEENEVRRAVSAAGYGITSSVALRRLVNNTVTGFTGNPFVPTGTTVFDRGNIGNGTKRTETVIT